MARNAYNTPPKPPVVPAKGHSKNPGQNTEDKALLHPPSVPSMFGKDNAK